MIGKNISHYKILEKLGEGGMGVVYKAQDLKLDRFVALKFLPPHLTSSEENKQRFIHEAKAASSLDHNNICAIYEIDETDDGQLFISMAYYEGETLNQRIKDKPLPIEDAITIAIQIAQGLAKAHEKEIVHRDIKPANIMLTADGVAKILDFGLAKLSTQTKLTKDSSSLGTVSYMSPEQTKGATVDHRTDIWSFGVVIYEMLSGQLPFKGEYDSAVIYSIMNDAPEPVTALRTGVPMELERIINKCLQKEASARYQAANELQVDLRQCEKLTGEVRTLRESVAHSKKAWFIGGTLTVVAALLILYFFGVFQRVTWDVAAEKPMLVVLPFKNLGSPEDEYFADGIIDEINARLSGVKGIRVIARTSAMVYKNGDKTAQAIGEELGVDYVLEGTVRWQRISGSVSQVRVTPKLIKAADETQIWAQVYQNDLVDIFQLQSDLSQQVVAALEVTLNERERRSIASIPTENLEAFNYYLRGKDYFFNRSNTKENRFSALEMYEKAIELDPNFALAHALASRVHANIYHFYYDRTEERLEKARGAAERAVALQPDLPEAYVALGHYHYRRLDYELALEDISQAQILQPGNSIVLGLLGLVQRRSGLWSQALANQKKAFRLDPHSYRMAKNLAHTHHYLHQYSEAISVLNRAISMQPDNWSSCASRAILYLSEAGNVPKVHSDLMQIKNITNSKVLKGFYLDDYQSWWILRSIGDYENVLSLLSFESFENDTSSYHLTKGELYGLLEKPKLMQGHYDSARVILLDQVQRYPEQALYYSYLGVAYAGLTQRELAIQHGERAVDMLPVSKEALWGRALLENLAWIYAKAGEEEQAIEKLEHLLSIPGVLTAEWLKVDPAWNNLRSHPRFQRLLDKYSGSG